MRWYNENIQWDDTMRWCNEAVQWNITMVSNVTRNVLTTVSHNGENISTPTQRMRFLSTYCTVRLLVVIYWAWIGQCFIGFSAGCIFQRRRIFWENTLSNVKSRIRAACGTVSCKLRAACRRVNCKTRAAYGRVNCKIRVVCERVRCMREGQLSRNIWKVVKS